MIHLRLKLSLCSHPPLFPPSLKLASTQEVQNSLSNIPLSKCFGLSTIWINCKRHWGLAGVSAWSEYFKNTISLITENDSLCRIHSQQDMEVFKWPLLVQKREKCLPLVKHSERIILAKSLAVWMHGNPFWYPPSQGMEINVLQHKHSQHCHCGFQALK